MLIALSDLCKKKWGCSMSKRLWGFSVDILGVFLMVILGTGCAPKSDSNSDNEYPFPMYNTSSPLYKELNSAQISCEDSTCEANRSDFEAIGVVGMLAKGKPTDYEFGLGQCTGFLYGSQEIVALNSHCITDSMWEHRDNCEEYLGIKFPSVPGHDEEVRMCDKILYRSDLSNENSFDIKADYAFFKIKKIKRKSLVLASNPVRNQEGISFRKVNPLKSVLGGRLDYSYCVAQTGSVLNSNYSNEWSDTGLGVSYGSKDYSKKCEIRQGNSGSPVLNMNNEVVGFAQSYATENFLKTLKSDLFIEAIKTKYQINASLNLPEKLPGHLHFTQRVCVRDPLSADVENTLCSDKRKSIPADNKEALADFSNAKNIDDYLKTITVGMNKVYPQFFQLELQKDKDFYRYQIKPKCVLNEDQWDKKNLNISDSTLFSKGKSVVMMQKPIGLELKIILNLDENLVYLSTDLTHSYSYGDLATNISGKNIKVTKSYDVGKYFTYKKEESVPNVDWCR